MSRSQPKRKYGTSYLESTLYSEERVTTPGGERVNPASEVIEGSGSLISGLVQVKLGEKWEIHESREKRSMNYWN